VRLGRAKKDPVDERPAVAAHLHGDDEITLERLAAFAQAPPDVQPLVLAQLRLQSEDQEAALLPAIEVMGLAILALFLTVTPDSMRIAVLTEPIIDPLGRWFSVTVGMGIFGLMAAALVLPTVRSVLKADRKRARAAAWHDAYDRELARQRAIPGRAGRSWRRLHPI